VLQTLETHKGLSGKIRDHTTTSFFVIAFLISWSAWFSGALVASSLMNSIAAFGPTLSAILVVAILNPAPSNASVKKRWVTFLVVFVGLFIFQLLALRYVTQNLTLENTLLTIIPSLIAAYIVSSIYHPKQGIASLLSPLKHVSARNVWIWVALVLPFIWQLLGGLIDWSLGGNELFTFTANNLVLLVAGYPFIFFFAGPIPEEPGWRGFATPRMQQRFSPLVTGLIIGVLWSTWHFPLHVVYLDGDVLGGFLFRFVYNVPFGVLFTWLYNRSGGNLFACLLLHASINSASGILGPISGLFSIIIMIGFVVAVVFYNKMYRKTVKPLEKQAATANAPPINTNLQLIG
jgi:uncharacterized protein